jgi:hypothetical protein
MSKTWAKVRVERMEMNYSAVRLNWELDASAQDWYNSKDDDNSAGLEVLEMESTKLLSSLGRAGEQC